MRQTLLRLLPMRRRQQPDGRPASHWGLRRQMRLVRLACLPCSLFLSGVAGLPAAHATPVDEATDGYYPLTLPRIVGRAGSGPDAEAIDLAAAQLVELIARVEAAASDARADESGVLAPSGSTGPNQRPSLSERDGEADGTGGTEDPEPTYAPGSALEVLTRIVNVHASTGRGEGEAEGQIRKAALAEAASGLPRLSDELERYIVSLVESRIAEDGTVYFTFPGIGEFRADYDSGTGVLAVRRGNAEVRVLLEERASGAVDGEAHGRITLDRLMAIIASLFDDTRVWYVLVPMLFLSMLVVRDGSAEVRERRRRRRAAGKIRGLGTTDGMTVESETLDLTIDETLHGDETEAGGHGAKRRRRRRTTASPAHTKGKDKPKSPGFFGTLMRSLGLKRDTPGTKVPLGGEKRSQRRRRKHRSAGSGTRGINPTGRSSA